MKLVSRGSDAHSAALQVLVEVAVLTYASLGIKARMGPVVFERVSRGLLLLVRELSAGCQLVVQHSLFLILQDSDPFLESNRSKLQVLCTLVKQLQPLVAACHIVEHHQFECGVHLDPGQLLNREDHLLRLRILVVSVF